MSNENYNQDNNLSNSDETMKNNRDDVKSDNRFDNNIVNNNLNKFDGKETKDYDNRNYTYNNNGNNDPNVYGTSTTQGSNPENQRQTEQQPAELNSNGSEYNGYVVNTSSNPGASGDNGSKNVPNHQNEGKHRGLLGTLSMVLVGAVLGSGITMASGNYFLNNNNSVVRSINTVTANNAASTTTSMPRTIVTAPAADTGVTPENLVAEKVTASVVGITTETKVNQSSFFGSGTGIGVIEGVGSGVIVSADGYIVTNSHVVDNGAAQNIKVVFSNELTVDGKVLWSDAALDLAIVKVDQTGLTPVEIGQSSLIKVGDKAIAIGNPLGLDLQSTLTSGYISGLDRSISIQTGGTMSGLIQTDAAINEGNSGGALLNAAGQLIGINTAKAGGGTSGIGFAIPIDTAKPIIEKVMSTGSFSSVYLGVSGMNVASVKAQNPTLNFSGTDGVYIMESMKGTAAANAGLVANDIITAIDDHAVTGMTELKKALLNYKVGDTVQVTYYRDNVKKTTQLKFAQDSSNIQQFTQPQATQPQP